MPKQTAQVSRHNNTDNNKKHTPNQQKCNPTNSTVEKLPRHAAARNDLARSATVADHQAPPPWPSSGVNISTNTIPTTSQSDPKIILGAPEPDQKSRIPTKNRRNNHSKKR
eukprot:3693263-Amphidinium_carterae.1